jgi:hypothetical protein
LPEGRAGMALLGNFRGSKFSVLIINMAPNITRPSRYLLDFKGLKKMRTKQNNKMRSQPTSNSAIYWTQTPKALLTKPFALTHPPHYYCHCRPTLRRSKHSHRHSHFFSSVISTNVLHISHTHATWSVQPMTLLSTYRYEAARRAAACRSWNLRSEFALYECVWTCQLAQHSQSCECECECRCCRLSDGQT